MLSTEQHVCHCLASVLKRLSDGASIPNNSDELRDTLNWLERFLPSILEQVDDEWRSVAMDGLRPPWRAKLGLARVVDRLHGPGHAEPTFRGGVRLIEFAHSQPEWARANAGGTLGRCLLKVGRYDEAEPYLRQAYDAMAGAFGASHASVRYWAAALVDLYEKTDRPELADHYRLPLR